MEDESTSADEIAKILTAMSDSFARRERDEHHELIEEFLHGRETLPTGREFEREYLRPRTLETIALIDALLAQFDNGANEELWRMKLYYKHHITLRSHVSSLMAKFEGSACSVDKSGILLRAYERLELTTRRGDRSQPMDSFKNEINELLHGAWITPQKESLCAWMDLIDQFIVLLTGQPEAYLKSYENLSESYKNEGEK